MEKPFANENDVKIENSVLTAWTTFDDMPLFKNETEDELNLLKGIIHYGFLKPSPIQSYGIVPLFEGHDLIAQAQSGTGKTGTYVIGSLASINLKLTDERGRSVVQVIVIAPSHELAIQINTVYNEIGSLMGIKTELCIGQRVSSKTNMQNIMEGKHILIGTPGRIFDLITRNVIDVGKVKMIILDEADKLLSGEFKMQVESIIDCLDDGFFSGRSRSRKQRLQMCIFSATLPPETISKCIRIMENPIRILVPVEELTLEGIRQYKINLTEWINNSHTNNRNYDDYIFNIKARLICDINKTKVIPQGIIYVNSISNAEKLYNYLQENDFSVTLIHRKKSSEERAQVMESFRRGESRILISTDLLARGLDVQSVMIVINFDIPNVTNNKSNAVGGELACSDYLHRIGRSGRHGKKGVAINFIATEEDIKRINIIEKYYAIKLEEMGDDLSMIWGT